MARTPRKQTERCEDEMPDNPGYLCQVKERDHSPPHKRGRIYWWDQTFWTGRKEEIDGY